MKEDRQSWVWGSASWAPRPRPDYNLKISLMCIFFSHFRGFVHILCQAHGCVSVKLSQVWSSARVKMTWHWLWSHLSHTQSHLHICSHTHTSRGPIPFFLNSLTTYICCLYSSFRNSVLLSVIIEPSDVLLLLLLLSFRALWLTQTQAEVQKSLQEHSTVTHYIFFYGLSDNLNRAERKSCVSLPSGTHTASFHLS